MALLDPGMVVWDVNDFVDNQGKYWSIATDVVALIEYIETSGLYPTARQEFIDVVITAFPAEHLDHGKQELRDFSNVIYSFLSREAINIIDYEQKDIVYCNPDLRERGHFCKELKEEITSLLCYATNHADSTVAFTHDQVVGCDLEYLTVNSGTKENTIDCYSSNKRYSEFFAGLFPIYEKNPKHDSLAGYGSRLPNCLTENDLQTLLGVAATKVDEKSLCAFCEKAQCFIVFRRHYANRYHAYPVEQNELSRIGVNPTEVVRA